MFGHADLQKDGTPDLQNLRPPAGARRDRLTLPYFASCCRPLASAGLSRRRYDSPSMTRS